MDAWFESLADGEPTSYSKSNGRGSGGGGGGGGGGSGGSASAGSDDVLRSIQKTFARCLGLYRARGYAGTISCSGQFGVYSESVSKTIYLANCQIPDESLAGKDARIAAGLQDSEKIDNTQSMAATLIRQLVNRMEQRATQWLEVRHSHTHIGPTYHPTYPQLAPSTYRPISLLAY